MIDSWKFYTKCDLVSNICLINQDLKWSFNVEYKKYFNGLILFIGKLNSLIPWIRFVIKGITNTIDSICSTRSDFTNTKFKHNWHLFIESKDITIALTGGAVSALNQNIFTSSRILYERYLYLLQVYKSNIVKNMVSRYFYISFIIIYFD